MSRFWSILGTIVGTLALVYYVIAGIVGGFGTSVLWVWAAAGIVLTTLALYDQLTLQKGFLFRLPLWILRYTICLCAVVFFSVQALVITGMTATAPAGAEVMLILGAQVKGEQPGIALTARLASAHTYLSENPATVAILCGGQGAGEAITEAECMRRYLTDRGIEENRLILEHRSTSTAENVRFARQLYPENADTVVVLSSHFHIYRSIRLAMSAGWTNVVGHAAPFSPILTPHYMAREFLTILSDGIHGRLG